jgi:hypothetical protein
MAATDTGYYDSSSDWAIQARKLSEEKFQLDLQSKQVHAERQGEQIGENRIIELWKSGKPLEEVIKEYGGN